MGSDYIGYILDNLVRDSPDIFVEIGLVAEDGKRCWSLGMSDTEITFGGMGGGSRFVAEMVTESIFLSSLSGMIGVEGSW